MNVLQQLNYLLNKKTKRTLILVVVMSVVGSAAELLGVTIVLPIVELAMDQGSGNGRLAAVLRDLTGADTKEELLIWMIVITIAIYIVKNIYVCFMYSSQFKFAASVKRETATRLMKSYLSRPYSFFLSKNSSELIRSVGTDTGQLFQLLSNLLTIFSNALTAACIIVFLASTNIAMTITVGVILGSCLMIIVFGLQKINRRNGEINIQLNGFLLKHLQQAFEGVKEIKIMNTEDYFIDTYASTFRRSTDMDIKYSIINTMPKYLIESFAVIAVLGFLGMNILFNPNYMELLPQLAAFCVAAFKLLPSVNAIYASFNSVVYYKASIDVVYNDIKLAEECEEENEFVNEDNSELSFDNEIRLENVSFRYAGSDHDVLSGINIEIKKGQSVALVGASGGGKTTTADIIISLLSPTSGRVQVDGVDIKNNKKAWRDKFGYIPQGIYLTDDSIRRNVAFGVPEDKIDDTRVWGALKEAQLEDFVRSLPEGLDTEVGERGARISGGQKQRIGIARALYRNPEILVFDEATSALDNETEKEVMGAIDGLQGTKTIIMIAHRLSTIENCDVVYKVENGSIEKTEKP